MCKAAVSFENSMWLRVLPAISGDQGRVGAAER